MCRKPFRIPLEQIIEREVMAGAVLGKCIEMKILRLLFSWQLLLLPLVAIAACSATAQQVYHRSRLGPGQAIVVVGVAHDAVVPREIFMIALDEYSSNTGKTDAYCFGYEQLQAYGPPESPSVKYFVYRVPAGIYAVGWDEFSPPNAQTFVAASGRAVYVGDFAAMKNSVIVDLRSDLAAARTAVAALLPVDVPLVKADWSDSSIRWTASRCSPGAN